MPGQLSAREVRKKKRGYRRASERDRKKKGVHVGDEGKAKKV